MTGFAAFTGIGTYAIYEARRQGTFANRRPPGGARFAGKAQAVIGFGMLIFPPDGLDAPCTMGWVIRHARVGREYDAARQNSC